MHQVYLIGNILNCQAELNNFTLDQFDNKLYLPKLWAFKGVVVWVFNGTILLYKLVSLAGVYLP